MKAISIILLGLALSGLAHASLSQKVVQELMSDQAIGQTIDITKMTAGYKGTCHVTYKKHMNGTFAEFNYTTEEALYVGNFVNARGDKIGLAISTENTHGNLTIPESLVFLLNADQEGFDFITEFVKKGYSGLDNNYGNVSKGKDYSFNYVASKQDKLLIVKTEKLMDCKDDEKALCNPPALDRCSYGYSQGIFIYEGCLRPNEQIAFKQLSETTILSHRTAEQLGNPSNNMSFFLPEISSFCIFEKR